jgi:hypothetical protein
MSYLVPFLTHQADEVVAVPFEEIEMSPEVERRRRIGLFSAASIS